jgi:uncharacterized protein YjbI with pentapeptide repeats
MDIIIKKEFSKNSKNSLPNNFENIIFQECIFQDISFTKQDFSNIHFKKCNITNVKFNDLSLKSIIISNSQIQNLQIKNCKFNNGLNFSNNKIDNLKLEKIETKNEFDFQLDNNNIKNSKILDIYGNNSFIIFKDTKFDNVEFKMNIRSLKSENSLIKNSKFTNSKILNVRMENIEIIDSDFRNNIFKGSTLEEFNDTNNLIYLNIKATGVNFSDSDFRYAMFIGDIYRKCKFNDCNFTNAIINSEILFIETTFENSNQEDFKYFYEPIDGEPIFSLYPQYTNNTNFNPNEELNNISLLNNIPANEIDITECNDLFYNSKLYLKDPDTILFINKDEQFCLNKQGLKWMIEDINNWIVDCAGGKELYILLPIDINKNYGLIRLSEILNYQDNKILYIKYDKTLKFTQGYIDKNGVGESYYKCQTDSSINVYSLYKCIGEKCICKLGTCKF